MILFKLFPISTIISLMIISSASFSGDMTYPSYLVARGTTPYGQTPLSSRDDEGKGKKRDLDGEVKEDEHPTSSITNHSNTSATPSIDEDGPCVICWDAPRSVRFQPCNHTACCPPCADIVVTGKNECPTCREPIKAHRVTRKQRALYDPSESVADSCAIGPVPFSLPTHCQISSNDNDCAQDKCVVCEENYCEVVFFCGHNVCCTPCAFVLGDSTKKCPACFASLEAAPYEARAAHSVGRFSEGEGENDVAAQEPGDIWQNRMPPLSNRHDNPAPAYFKSPAPRQVRQRLQTPAATPQRFRVPKNLEARSAINWKQERAFLDRFKELNDEAWEKDESHIFNESVFITELTVPPSPTSHNNVTPSYTTQRRIPAGTRSVRASHFDREMDNDAKEASSESSEAIIASAEQCARGQNQWMDGNEQLANNFLVASQQSAFGKTREKYLKYFSQQHEGLTAGEGCAINTSLVSEFLTRMANNMMNDLRNVIPVPEKPLDGYWTVNNVRIPNQGITTVGRLSSSTIKIKDASRMHLAIFALPKPYNALIVMDAASYLGTNLVQFDSPIRRASNLIHPKFHAFFIIKQGHEAVFQLNGNAGPKVVAQWVNNN